MENVGSGLTPLEVGVLASLQWMEKHKYELLECHPSNLFTLTMPLNWVLFEPWYSMYCVLD